MKNKNNEIRIYLKKIEIIDRFREAFRQIITMSLYGISIIPTEKELIDYQKSRVEVIKEGISLDIKKYDELIAQSTSKLNKIPLYSPA